MKKWVNKQTIIVCIMTALLFSAMPLKATIDEYICYKADYKLVIDGQEFNDPDLPLMNYKGFTVASVSKILKAVGVPITWNAEHKQAEVTAKTASIEKILPEYPTALPEIKYDDITDLPEGATYTTYKGCNTAVLYNRETYLSKNDLLTYFAIKYKYTDDKNNSTVYGTSTVDFTINFDDSSLYFFNRQGTPYFKAGIFSSVIGD